jgi:hypothetical protein
MNNGVNDILDKIRSNKISGNKGMPNYIWVDEVAHFSKESILFGLSLFKKLAIKGIIRKITFEAMSIFDVKAINGFILLNKQIRKIYCYTFFNKILFSFLQWCKKFNSGKNKNKDKIKFITTEYFQDFGNPDKPKPKTEEERESIRIGKFAKTLKIRDQIKYRSKYWAKNILKNDNIFIYGHHSGKYTKNSTGNIIYKSVGPSFFNIAISAKKIIHFMPGNKIGDIKNCYQSSTDEKRLKPNKVYDGNMNIKFRQIGFQGCFDGKNSQQSYANSKNYNLLYLLPTSTLVFPKFIK